jgi:hypothetical protein
MVIIMTASCWICSLYSCCKIHPSYNLQSYSKMKVKRATSKCLSFNKFYIFVIEYNTVFTSCLISRKNNTLCFVWVKVNSGVAWVFFLVRQFARGSGNKKKWAIETHFPEFKWIFYYFNNNRNNTQKTISICVKWLCLWIYFRTLGVATW